ncbi:ArsA family ATPase [Pseudokineococcus sp. 1T1Z-3]|uniref:ArsA family ATPase n=1 Tax=Pseudokineococcus sp. 1T1Z-3 TaxID=3132745 RepID=UPI0030B1DF5C
MLLDLAARRRVLLVGGKGGVGKTTVASAAALHQARAGRRVLVVSTDPAHNLGHLWQRRVGDTAVPLAEGLDGLEVDARRTTEEHLRAVGATLRRLMPEHLAGEVDKHLDLARDAPGTHEAAVLERLAQVLEDSPHDLVVLDTAPSGHTVRLVQLPETMSAWTDGLLRRRERSARFGAALRTVGGAPDGDVSDGVFGPSRRRDRRPAGRPERDEEIRRVLERRRARLVHLRDLLTDADRTSVALVLTAERLPVAETLEVHAQLGRAGLDVGALVVNRRSPAGAGELLERRRVEEERHLDVLRRGLPDVPRCELPLLAGDVVGADGLALVAGCLEQTT